MIKFWSKFHIEIFRYSFTRDKKFLLTPSHFLPGKQEKNSSNASKHVNNSLSVYFFLNSELSNGRMKVQVKRAFESYFLSPKKQQQESRQALHEIFFNPQYKCAEVSKSPTSKSTPSFSAGSSFSKNVSTLKSVVKRTYGRLPP